MSQPEIFRRCSSCGATFRTGALFCPQCGKASATDTTAAAAEGRIEEAAQPAANRQAADRKANTAPDIPAQAKVAANPIRDSRAGDERALTARNALERRVRPRVDKIRKASSVVLDEASYDPSVRFILIVGVLFALFLLLLFLSKWLG